MRAEAGEAVGGRWTPERRARQAELLRERKGGQSPWTPARLKLLREGYPTRDLRELLRELNALPGFELRSIDSIRYRAEKDQLRRDEATMQAVKREAMRRANEKRLNGELPPVESISAAEQEALRQRRRDAMSAMGLRNQQAADAAGVPVGSLGPWIVGKSGSGTAAKVRAWLDKLNPPREPPAAPHGVKARLAAEGGEA